MGFVIGVDFGDFGLVLACDCIVWVGMMFLVIFVWVLWVLTGVRISYSKVGLGGF